MQIVQHEPHVASGIPVQASRIDQLLPAGDAGRGGELIVEIHHAHAAGDLKRAPAAAVERERIRRVDAAIRGTRRIVSVGFSGKHVAGLGIAALEV